MAAGDRPRGAAGWRPDGDRASHAGGPLVLGTAGHIDHGKTALVAALTGADTDRLAEEKRRGISLELGFAELTLPGGRRLGVIDVPGHERLVRTMVAGAGGIDLFLLAIAADDGVMPQTREHLAVLRALGVGAGVIALTKVDAVDDQLRELAAAEAGALVPGAPLVAVSARTGEGLVALRRALAEVAAAARPRAEREAADPAVLHIDRCFTLHGIGTVVTGTLAAGTLAAGDPVEVLPGGLRTRVRSLQVHGEPRTAAVCGERVALNLRGVERAAVRRGDVVAAPQGGLRPTYRLDIELALEPGAGELAGRRVQVHHGTRDVAARVVALGAGAAQLRLSAPLLALPGDRVVIRRIAPPDTLGGGLVVDPAPRRHGPGAPGSWPELLRGGDPAALLAAAAAREPGGIAIDPDRWPRSSPLRLARERHRADALRQAGERLVAAGELARRGERLVAELGAEGDAAGAEPDRRGEQRDGPLGRTELLVLALLVRAGDRPPPTVELARRLGIEPRRAAAALARLARAGEVVRLSGDVAYPTATLRRLEALALALAVERGELTLAGVRDGLGTTRKYAQALVGHLDATRVTVRHGDRHLLRRRAGADR